MECYFQHFGKCTVSEEKKGQLKDRMLTLFRAGGMMDFEHVSLFGYNLKVLVPPNYRTLKADWNILEDTEQVTALYNYYDDSWWERGGYNATKGEVINCGCGGMFAKTMYAANILLELHSDTFFITACDGEIHYKGQTVGWLNYLFNENYTLDRTSDLQRIRNLLPKALRGQDLSDVSRTDGTVIEPVCTALFFIMPSEDRLYGWRPDSDVRITTQTEDWFATLRAEFDEILTSEYPAVDSADYIRDFLATLDQVNRDYLRIFFFKDAFEEFLCCGFDRRYQAALILLQRLAERHADEIPNLQTSDWFFQWKTSGRLTIKRYIALLANKELRQRVLGF